MKQLLRSPCYAPPMADDDSSIIPRERLTDGADWRNRSELNEHGNVAWGCECSAWNSLKLVLCWRCDRERARRAPYQSIGDMIAAMNRACNQGAQHRHGQ